MKNPFRPGNGTMPPYLAGRRDELLWFEKSLDSALDLPQNLVLSGIRGTGKTVLLRKFSEICADKRWLFVTREFNDKLNREPEFLNALLTDIISKERGVSLAGRLRKRAVGFRTVDGANNESDPISVILQRYRGPLVDRVEAILEDVHESLLGAGHHGLVLLYDEFHFIEDGKIAGSFPLSLLLESFSHVQRQGLRYYLVLSGLPQLFPNLVKAKTYAERMFKVTTLENLSAEAAREAVKLPLEESETAFTGELIDTIVSETGGYPYFLQFYPFYLLQNVPKKRFGRRELDRMQPLILRELDESFFSGRFSRASDGEQKLLFEMARLGPEIRLSELKKRIDIDKNYLNQILIGLVRKGLIFRAGRGRYRFALPLFEKFLLRKSEP